MRILVGIVGCCLYAGGWGVPARAVPLVWSGYDFHFERPDGVDHTLPQFQDQITSNVAIARASLQGIFNAVVEDSYSAGAPTGTAWAFPMNNPGVTVSASNWEALNFDTWVNAVQHMPPGMVGEDAVVHLISDDVYLDLRFSYWGNAREGGQGGFTYDRAAAVPSADFDRDGNVDADDRAVWEANFGTADALQTEGDADWDGDVDGRDFLIWQLGAAPAGSASAQAVPEPTGLTLLGAALAAIVWRPGRRGR